MAAPSPIPNQPPVDAYPPAAVVDGSSPYHLLSSDSPDVKPRNFKKSILGRPSIQQAANHILAVLSSSPIM
ncbi:unnamed protein product, partial [Ilex paraguariensis]